MKLSLLTTALLACSLSIAPMSGFANCVNKTSNKQASAAYKSKAKGKKVARRSTRSAAGTSLAAGSAAGSTAAGGMSSSKASTLNTASGASDSNVTGANAGCVSQNRGGGLGDQDVCPAQNASNTTENPSAGGAVVAPLAATDSSTSTTASAASSSDALGSSANSNMSTAAADSGMSSSSTAGSSAAGGQSDLSKEPVFTRSYGSQPTGANSGCVSPNRGGALGDPDICPFATVNQAIPQ